jgi:hypothetical protein
MNKPPAFLKQRGNKKNKKKKKKKKKRAAVYNKMDHQSCSLFFPSLSTFFFFSIWCGRFVDFSVSPTSLLCIFKKGTKKKKKEKLKSLCFFGDNTKRV